MSEHCDWMVGRAHFSKADTPPAWVCANHVLRLVVVKPRELHSGYVWLMQFTEIKREREERERERERDILLHLLFFSSRS